MDLMIVLGMYIFLGLAVFIAGNIWEINSKL